MSDADWLLVLSRLSPEPAQDIDGDLFSRPGATPGMAELRGDCTAGTGSARLWEAPDIAWTRFGVRVLEPLAEPVQLAARLASAAIERKVVPVILTTLAVSGFERFGFRVERLPDDAEERARCEAELTAFWNLALILDARDVAVLS